MTGFPEIHGPVGVMSDSSPLSIVDSIPPPLLPPLLLPRGVTVQVTLASRKWTDGKAD